jgi:sugar lactone lactonase YvrE
MISKRILFALAALFASTFLTRAAGIANFASANLVLGQTLFTTNASPSPAIPSSLRNPEGIAIDPVSGKIFVADTKNNRVLRFANQSALSNGANPETVIGQLNLSGSLANQGLANPTSNSLSKPTDVFVDVNGGLWIADSGNNRVLLFLGASGLSNGPVSDRVYGQPDFTTATAAPTAAKMASPTGICVDPAGVLWVADTGSHRVLAFKNAANLNNGASADRVLGQTDFTSNSAAATQSKFFNPMGVAADAENVWVADTGNNRVLLFTNFPTADGAKASLVLGQTNYTASTALPASDSSFNGPTGVAIAGTSLWVADSGYNRVMRFDNVTSLTFASGSPASGVLGQATFVTGSAGVSAQRFSLAVDTTTRDASHLTIDPSGNLWLADSANNRVLRFIYTAPTPVVPVIPTTVTLTGKKKITTSKANYTLRGTATSSAGIRRVSYNQNDEGYVKAKGTTSWKAKIKLPFGRTKIVINSVALDGTVSPPVKVTIDRE